MSNFRRALGYIIPCALLAIILNFSKFFETETATFCLDFRGCGCGYHTSTYVRPTRLRLSQTYILWYSTWTWVSLTSTLPFITLLLLNFSIWRRLSLAQRLVPQHSQVQSQSQSQSQSTTGEKTNLSSSIILLCTVATFLVCHSPRYSQLICTSPHPITIIYYLSQTSSGGLRSLQDPVHTALSVKVEGNSEQDFVILANFIRHFNIKKIV